MMSILVGDRCSWNGNEGTVRRIDGDRWLFVEWDQWGDDPSNGAIGPIAQSLPAFKLLLNDEGIPIAHRSTTLNRDAMRAMADFLRGITTQVKLDVSAMAARAHEHEPRKSKAVLMSDVASHAWSSQVRAGIAALAKRRANVIACDGGYDDDWGPWR